MRVTKLCVGHSPLSQPSISDDYICSHIHNFRSFRSYRYIYKITHLQLSTAIQCFVYGIPLTLQRHISKPRYSVANKPHYRYSFQYIRFSNSLTPFVSFSLCHSTLLCTLLVNLPLLQNQDHSSQKNYSEVNTGVLSPTGLIHTSLATRVCPSIIYINISMNPVSIQTYGIFLS